MSVALKRLPGNHVCMQTFFVNFTVRYMLLIPYQHLLCVLVTLFECILHLYVTEIHIFVCDAGVLKPINHVKDKGNKEM